MVQRGSCALIHENRARKDIATIYKGNRNVLFDLYGEPFQISFDTWMNGGTVSIPCYDVSAGKSEARAGTYQAIRDLKDSTRVKASAPDSGKGKKS